MKVSFREIFLLFISIASWSYLILLIGWIVLHLLTGDRIAYLAAANFLIVYLFLPLPLVLLGALLTRSRSLGIGFGIGALVFLWLWGPQFLPRLRHPPAQNPALTVMTYNVLAWHTYTQPVIENIRAQSVDIVFLQELNHNLARALSTELKDEFPYQILEPVDSPSGIGVISRFPIRPTGERLPLHWIGGPQVLELDWNGQAVTLVNIHMVPNTRMGRTAIIEPPIRLREAQAQELVKLARSREHPGDHRRRCEFCASQRGNQDHHPRTAGRLVGGRFWPRPYLPRKHDPGQRPAAPRQGQVRPSLADPHRLCVSLQRLVRRLGKTRALRSSLRPPGGDCRLEAEKVGT
jgi:endonuclease/exonuclease/phosphatase (EEP) superfamily protein YafD